MPDPTTRTQSGSASSDHLFPQPRGTSTTRRGSALHAGSTASALADRQHGTVATWQLLRAGLTDGEIRGLIRRGQLHRVRPGAYSVGRPSLSRDGEFLVELLALGPDPLAGLSHWSAVEIRLGHRYVPKVHRSVVHLLSRRQHMTATATSRRHRSRTLVPADLRSWNRMRVATMERAVVDLAAAGTDRFRLAQVLHEAEFRHCLRTRALHQVMERNMYRNHQEELRHACHMHSTGSAGTKSELEHHLALNVLASTLPDPLVNTAASLVDGRLVPVPRGPGGTLPIDAVEPDLWWPMFGLVVQVDGSGHVRLVTKRDDHELDEIYAQADVHVLHLPGRLVSRNVDRAVAEIGRALGTRTFTSGQRFA